MKKSIFFTTFLVIFLSMNLSAEQIIIEEIEDIYNYQIKNISFDFSKINLNLSDYSYRYLLIKKKYPVDRTLISLFSSYNIELHSETRTSNYAVNTDRITLKKYLILDTNYQILNINNVSFYKFKIYFNDKQKKKGFISSLLEQYAVEYNIKNIK